MQVEVSPHPAVPCQPLTPRTVRARFLLLVADPDLTGAEALSRQLHDRQIDVVVTDNPADGLLQAGALLPDAVLTAAGVPPMRGSTIARALSSRTGIPTLVGVGIDDRNEGREDLDACGGEDRVEHGGELRIPIPDQKPEPVGSLATVHQQVAGLLDHPLPHQMCGDTEHMDPPAAPPRPRTARTGWRSNTVSTLKKSTARTPSGWARRNCRQVTADRFGCRIDPRPLKHAQTVLAPTR